LDGLASGILRTSFADPKKFWIKFSIGKEARDAGEIPQKQEVRGIPEEG
jgi:hypothetical protein